MLTSFTMVFFLESVEGDWNWNMTSLNTSKLTEECRDISILLSPCVWGQYDSNAYLLTYMSVLYVIE